MSSATFIGLLHKRICTFSPRTFVPSVKTSFCVGIRITISVQKQVSPLVFNLYSCRQQARSQSSGCVLHRESCSPWTLSSPSYPQLQCLSPRLPAFFRHRSLWALSSCRQGVNHVRQRVWVCRISCKDRGVADETFRVDALGQHE